MLTGNQLIARLLQADAGVQIAFGAANNQNAEVSASSPAGFPSKAGQTARPSYRTPRFSIWPAKALNSPSRARQRMINSFRRYEILLPKQFNTGQPVPDELIGETLLELRKQFGSVSSETQIIRGTWEHQEQVFRATWCAYLRTFQTHLKTDNSLLNSKNESKHASNRSRSG